MSFIFKTIKARKSRKGKKHEEEAKAEQALPKSSSISESEGTFSSIEGSTWDETGFYDKTKPTSHLVQVQSRNRWEIHDSVIDCIGQTPIVKLQRMGPPGVNVYIKLENTNPGGSLKDRLGCGTIEWAEIHGKIKPGQTVIEASSGNTGTSLVFSLLSIIQDINAHSPFCVQSYHLLRHCACNGVRGQGLSLRVRDV